MSAWDNALAELGWRRRGAWQLLEYGIGFAAQVGRSDPHNRRPRYPTTVAGRLALNADNPGRSPAEEGLWQR